MTTPVVFLGIRDAPAIFDTTCLHFCIVIDTDVIVTWLSLFDAAAFQYRNDPKFSDR